MRKKLMIVLAMFTLVSGLLGGCTQDSNNGLNHSGDIKYFIGTWVNVTNSTNSSGVNESYMRIYNFTDNNFHYNYFAIIGSDRYNAVTDGTYELKDGNLIVSNTTAVPPKKATFHYSFSYNYTALTLTDESGHSIKYIKFILG